MFFSVSIFVTMLLTREFFVAAPEPEPNLVVRENEIIAEAEVREEDVLAGVEEMDAEVNDPLPPLDAPWDADELDRIIQQNEPQPEHVPEIVLAEVFGIAGNPITGTI